MEPVFGSREVLLPALRAAQGLSASKFKILLSSTGHLPFIPCAAQLSTGASTARSTGGQPEPPCYGRLVPAAKIDAVVFDLGGVLLDWDPRHLYRQIFADPAEMETFLGTICTQQWHVAHDLGADITLSCRLLAQQHPGYAAQIMAWAERTEEMVRGQLDDTVELLAELKRAGLRCYVLSNMEAPCFEVRLGRFGFLHWFDGHVISGVERVAKPDRRIFRILLARYGLTAERTIFVDDSDANIGAARQLGIIGIRFTAAGQLRRDLRLAGLEWPEAPAASMAEAEPPHGGPHSAPLSSQHAAPEQL